MNIYLLRVSGEHEWLKGNTIIDVLQFYLNEILGDSINDLADDDEIVEVPEILWDEKIIKNSDWEEGEPLYYSLRELANETPEEVAYLASSVY